MLDNIDEAANRRGHDRNSTTQRLQNSNAEAFAFGRMHYAVQLRQQPREVIPEACQPNVGRQRQLLNLLLLLLLQRPLPEAQNLHFGVRRD